MRLHTLTLALLAPVAAFGLVALASREPVTPPAAAPETLTIDNGHSNVIFKCKHFQASWFYGRFGQISGTIEFDEANPGSSSVEMEVKADSVDSGIGDLDKHLKSPDFFDAKQFPVISFKSTKVKKKGDGFAVTGDLSLHGVTKSITVEMEHVGTGKHMRGHKVVGFHTVFTIDRTEYGMNYGAGGPLGSDVEIIISVEAYGK